MTSRLKQIPIGLLRLGVSVGLLYLIVSKVGLTAPLERVIGLDWPAVVGAAALILVTIALHTKRC